MAKKALWATITGGVAAAAAVAIALAFAVPAAAGTGGQAVVAAECRGFAAKRGETRQAGGVRPTEEARAEAAGPADPAQRRREHPRLDRLADREGRDGDGRRRRPSWPSCTPTRPRCGPRSSIR